MRPEFLKILTGENGLENQKLIIPSLPESIGWASFNGPAQVLPEEYPAYGGLCYHEPCLKMTFADGVRDVVLQFVSEKSDKNEIVIVFTGYPLSCKSGTALSFTSPI